MRFSDNFKQRYELTNLPGCSQVAVSHDLFIHPDERGKGNSYYAGILRIAKMQELGYNYALCTVGSYNVAEIKQLKENGWKELDYFYSDKTGHTVYLYGRNLNAS